MLCPPFVDLGNTGGWALRTTMMAVGRKGNQLQLIDATRVGSADSNRKGGEGAAAHGVCGLVEGGGHC